MLERMIEAGMNEFKENRARFCEQVAQDGLSPESALVVTAEKRHKRAA